MQTKLKGIILLKLMSIDSKFATSPCSLILSVGPNRETIRRDGVLSLFSFEIVARMAHNRHSTPRMISCATLGEGRRRAILSTNADEHILFSSSCKSYFGLRSFPHEAARNATNRRSLSADTQQSRQTQKRHVRRMLLQELIRNLGQTRLRRVPPRRERQYSSCNKRDPRS